jgi:hypothetical protein
MMKWTVDLNAFVTVEFVEAATAEEAERKARAYVHDAILTRAGWVGPDGMQLTNISLDDSGSTVEPQR